MVQCDPGFYSLSDTFIDDLVIECYPFGIDFSGTLRKDS